MVLLSSSCSRIYNLIKINLKTNPPAQKRSRSAIKLHEYTQLKAIDLIPIYITENHINYESIPKLETEIKQLNESINFTIPGYKNCKNQIILQIIIKNTNLSDEINH